MPFSTEDKVIIKHYRLNKHYEVKRMLKEFPNKGWTKWGLRDLLGKIDKTRDFALIPGSSRTLTVLTKQNIEKLKSLFSVKKKIQELMKVKEILEELLVYQKPLSAEMQKIPWFNYFLQDKSSRFEWRW